MNSEERSSQFYDSYSSPLGTIYLIFSGKYLTGVSFEKPSDKPFKKESAPVEFIKELNDYFSGSECKFTPQLKFVTGTDFEREVWAALNMIPAGETRSYKWIAETIGRPGAVRAVGQALSKNPIPIVVPCHRIIESDGSIGGYALGVNMKVRLLEMEYYSKMNNNPDLK